MYFLFYVKRTFFFTWNSCYFRKVIWICKFFLVPILYQQTQSLLFIEFLCLGLSIFSNILALLQYYMDKKYRIVQYSGPKIKFSDIKNLGLNYWLLVIAITLFYPTMISYFSVSSKILQLRFSFTMTQAGEISSFTYVIITILCPCIGLLLDKFGLRILFAIIGSFIMLSGHFLLGFLPDKDYRPWPVILAYALMGCGYPAFSVSAFSSIPIIVKREFVGI